MSAACTMPVVKMLNMWDRTIGVTLMMAIAIMLPVVATLLIFKCNLWRIKMKNHVEKKTVLTRGWMATKREDYAAMLVLLSLLGTMGGAVDNSISGATWTNTLPGKFQEYLPESTKSK